MIGVIAGDSEVAVAREFFELFKTPWEIWNSEKAYDVVLCATGECPEHLQAALVLVYSGKRLASDPEDTVEERGDHGAKSLRYKDSEIPIYGGCVNFPGGDSGILADRESGQPAILHKEPGEQQTILRVGYNLFEEIRFLLTSGQPVEQAGIPTLELHIEFLRDQLLAAGIAFVEIPPVPEGYRFIVCLTHDVDHPSIRKHRWDHTAAGFLYRGTVGTFLSFVRGRCSVRALVRNWIAVAKWPFVQVGLAKDFWLDFAERYREIEEGAASTYFVIPFAGTPGRSVKRSTAKRRAAGYGARDIEPAIRNILKNKNEIGLHGIDAWMDSEAGLKELEEIRTLTGKAEIGVRMHWLCYDQRSPEELERAGASYDSTVGYGETVGYRTGTSQAYVPPGADYLMELPMHVMDTALFYPAYLGLTEEEADKILAKLVNNADRFGGCITVNWHDRSLAPERVWDACYRKLIDDLRVQGAWFATASQAVSWFRDRRSVVFETDRSDSKELCATTTSAHDERLPDLRLRIQKPNPDRDRSNSAGFVDVGINRSAVVPAVCEADA